MNYLNNLAFVAIAKNEAPYIREWILFHQMVGVDKFYIYDNESSDNLYSEIKDFIDSGLVEYKYYPGRCMQFPAYCDAINAHKNECKYMGFIDCDEFVHPVNENLIDILDSKIKNDVAGIAINWRTYGSSYMLTKPDGLVIENFKYRSTDEDPINSHIKTICNPRFVVGFNNPHFPLYINGYYSVGENDDKVEGPFRPCGSVNKIRINHYFTKSKEEYIKKMLRGKADLLNYRTMDEFYARDKNDIYDYNLEGYTEFIKNNINKVKKL